MTPTLPVSLPSLSPATLRSRRKKRKIPAGARITGIGLILLLCFSTVVSPIPDRWALSLFQSGIFVLTAGWIVRCVWRGRPLAPKPTFTLALAIPALGIFQIAFGLTVHRHVTREAILYWASASCIAFLSSCLCEWQPLRQAFRLVLAALAVLLALANMTGLMAPGGMFAAAASAGNALGLFASSNQFAELMELALPLCLAAALHDRKRWLVFALAAAIIFAAAIGSRSRMGAAVVTAEVVAVLFLARSQNSISSRHWRHVSAVMLLLALAFALAIGVSGLYARLQDPAPMAGRSEIFTASIRAFAQRPLLGFGLGTFASIYPEYAPADLGGVVLHAHDDYLEALCDGGIPLLLLLVLIFGRLLRPAAASLWGVGLIAILLHGAVDFPLQRMSICAWSFVIAGALDVNVISKPTDSPASKDLA